MEMAALAVEAAPPSQPMAARSKSVARLTL